MSENPIYSPRHTLLKGAGVDLAADVFGAPHGSPVLLLHGGGQTRHAWRRTATVLGESGFYAIALDLRGHGDSDWPANGGYEPDHFAQDIECVARSFERRPAVIGASLGGMTALGAQRRAPEQLFSAVVLVDIVPKLERDGVERIIRFMLAYPKGFSSLDEAAEAISSYRPDKPRPSDLSGLRRTLQQRDDGRWHWRWDIRFLSQRFSLGETGIEALDARHARMREELIAGAKKLRVPTLLVRGAESDVVSREGIDEFLSVVPHAEWIDVANAGHMVSGDANDAFSAAVESFLRRKLSVEQHG